MELSGGHYHILARLKVSDNTPDAVVATMYVKALRNNVEQTLASRDIRAREFEEAGKWQVFVLPVDINEDDEDVRIGVEFHPGVTDLWCDWIRVQLAGLLHTGLFERGGIRDLWAIKDGLFTADASGRAKFEPGFVNNALIYPDIDASKITSGILDVARIPDLDASKITSGILDVARIPDLDASKITSGVLDIARIPVLPGDKIASGAITAEHLSYGIDASGKGFRAADSSMWDGHSWGDTYPNADMLDGHHAGTGANDVLVLDGNGLVPVGCIPGLDASKIVSGVLSLDRLPTIPFGKLDVELQRAIGRYWEAEDYGGTTGSGVSDSTASEGLARKASSSDPSGTLVEVA